MKKRKYLKRFVKYIHRTYKNKIVALAMIALSALSMLWTKDATALVFISLIAIPLFFVGENYIQ